MKKCLENLSDYSNHNKFQQGVINFLTYTTSHKEEIDRLSEIFKAIDVNNDGHLSKDEITKYIKEVMGSSNIEEITEIYDKVDTNKSGFIDYTEFLSAAISKNVILRK